MTTVHSPAPAQVNLSWRNEERGTCGDEPRKDTVLHISIPQERCYNYFLLVYISSSPLTPKPEFGLLRPSSRAGSRGKRAPLKAAAAQTTSSLQG